MKYLHLRNTSLRPLALAVGTAWALTAGGCYSWHALPSTLPPPSDIVHQPVRVTLRSGQVRSLDDASVTGDSLIWWEERAFKLTRQRAGSLPVSEIAKLEVRRLDVGKSIAAGAGGAVVGTAVVVGLLYAAVLVGWKNSGGGVW